LPDGLVLGVQQDDGFGLVFDARLVCSPLAVSSR
jgi:hypothetical protein